MDRKLIRLGWIAGVVLLAAAGLMTAKGRAQTVQNPDPPLLYLSAPIGVQGGQTLRASFSANFLPAVQRFKPLTGQIRFLAIRDDGSVAADSGIMALPAVQFVSIDWGDAQLFPGADRESSSPSASQVQVAIAVWPTTPASTRSLIGLLIPHRAGIEVLDDATGQTRVAQQMAPSELLPAVQLPPVPATTGGS